MNQVKFKSEEEHKPLTVEDLLHLKRFEQPEPDFWDDFQSEFRRRAMESVVIEPVESGTWRRIALKWFAPTFGMGAIAAALLIFTGGPLLDSTDALTVNAPLITSPHMGDPLLLVSPAVAESRGGEFVDGAIALTFSDEVEGVVTGFMGKSIRFASADATFEESVLTLYASDSEQPVHPVTF
ncbi:MAG: hypothetical protein OSB39_10395 [Opitutales bacterium]|nr:hypothetical protein [Opitutales bacterium]